MAQVDNCKMPLLGKTPTTQADKNLQSLEKCIMELTQHVNKLQAELRAQKDYVDRWIQALQHLRIEQQDCEVTSAAPVACNVTCHSDEILVHAGCSIPGAVETGYVQNTGYNRGGNSWGCAYGAMPKPGYPQLKAVRAEAFCAKIPQP